ncbi:MULTISPECIES: DUF262 domain-containing protein [Phaeobacter]|uniref:DUF262 domain-containing protein n=3 Tax=Phaeobacter TaxID=302485 RepID=A0AAD0EFD5_9RHOB|nr:MULTISPECIES: DUF262 domain-containing protein [Phaeobacter]AHD11993.1 Uncharacterized protein Gal_04289 [Phaeobacter gallaeciensis DSM 26640]ATE99576.1 hypothetical protein PhaeoP73_04316 [Phaeobacter gallaeciensis]ATF08166.1 hypothetical protein PhaeoP63_04135 [Phaeobacter gallaeciensis]ATG45894.1 hypothetical protein PhaeoP13_04012 [Phaeobacter piscinae]AUR01836.1 hypothetical protein PhaeoP88_04524 [Phaeobacter inhibens]
MYHPGGTIEKAVGEIAKNSYVLPAIQREFVWRPEQIERLFDSLMQGYPFGAFLFWKVLPETATEFQFYDFVRDYNEFKGIHSPKIEVQKGLGVTAVLDGQQRLTALNIGLRGSMRLKLKGKHKKNPEAYPIRYLYINLLHDGTETENGIFYEFKFLEPKTANDDGDKCWFRVGKILDFSSMAAIPDLVEEEYDFDKEQRKAARKTLNRLFEVIRSNPTVAYYEEGSQELNRVLNIFIRLNSGGTILSYSDLLLSIAVAQWTELDAREEIHSLVDTLNDIGSGFNFSHDFVLKAGLMLSDIASVGFKVDNFSKKNMALLQDNWPAIRSALTRTVQLASSLGLSGANLRAESSLLPIAYYMFKNSSPDGFEIKGKYKDQRAAIRDWLFRSLLKPSGIWGSGLDTLLTALRDVLRKADEGVFPANELAGVMSKRGKQLSFSEDELYELLDMGYGDKRTFLLLSMLFPHVDLNNQFHVDHVFPISRFTSSKLGKAGFSEETQTEMREWANTIANLQLLEGQLNKEKNAALPSDWLRDNFGNEKARVNYGDLHDLGDVPEDLGGFLTFAKARYENLFKRLEAQLK